MIGQDKLPVYEVIVLFDEPSGMITTQVLRITSGTTI
jgi:hypothetical protein